MKILNCEDNKMWRLNCEAEENGKKKIFCENQKNWKYKIVKRIFFVKLNKKKYIQKKIFTLSSYF